MINQINPGALLPIYNTQIDHQKHLTRQLDGWAIRVPRKTLIPMMLWRDAVGVIVNEFVLMNLETGQLFLLDPLLWEAVERTDLTRTWFYLPVLADIGEDIPCGYYQAYMRVGGLDYWSEIMELVDFCGFESSEVIKIGCSGNNHTFNVIDNLIGTIVSEAAEWRYQGQGAWADAGVSGGSFVLTPNASGGNTFLNIRRRVTTSCGNKLERLYTMDFSNTPPCQNAVVKQIADNSQYASGDVWMLEYSDDTRWSDVIFPGTFKNRFYFNGFFEFPEQQRATEVLLDNNGNETISNALTTSIIEMHMDRVPDFAQYSLAGIGDYTDITLTNPARGVQIKSLSDPEITFEPLNSGYFSRGILRFKAHQNFDWACLPAEETQSV